MILPTNFKRVTIVLPPVTSSSSNTAGIQEQQVIMRVVASIRGVNRVGGGNVGGDCRKMILD